MAHLLLVANPSASGFTGAHYRDVGTLLAGGYDVTEVWPQTPQEARRAAAQAAADGFRMVAAMGGDGVVHHVTNGLAGSQTALGIIPVGTTNVLARILSVPLDPRKAARYLAGNPSIAPVPVARLEAARPGWASSEYATFAVGVGYDAEVVGYAERRPHRKAVLGGVHFARSAAWMFLKEYRRRPATLRVQSGDRRADASAVMVQIHWPYTYFGRLPLKITPTPTLGMEVLVLDGLRASRTPAIVARAALGRPLDPIPGVTVWSEVFDLTVTAEPAGLMQADGELLGRVDQLRVVSVPEQLLVAAPRPSP